MTEQSELPRETGAAKDGRKCPTCGGPLQLTESPYGSVVARCPKCSAAPVQRQQAQQAELPRETGTKTDG